ncbi:hypothetical protein BpHYR1_032943 [Brachionus plicatilis]|uniref:Uncharacterized protein n=1 Tax=Brachionus plicatilis TaxID=10195 RepID=A0A3M7RQ45_BRAPC|nr:hypothetical protein BpHYR1_032943 [Brachionus plicatilis]
MNNSCNLNLGPVDEILNNFFDIYAKIFADCLHIFIIICHMLFKSIIGESFNCFSTIRRHLRSDRGATVSIKKDTDRFIYEEMLYSILEIYLYRFFDEQLDNNLILKKRKNVAGSGYAK